jgi:DNA invertase Pin-like site-specific DNA recombinase
MRWAEAHKVAVAETYIDNDISATSGKRRPEYERMIADIRECRRDGVITWHLDRLHRNPIELEQFIILIESTGADVRTVTGGDYDLSTSDGRAMARPSDVERS